MGALDGGRRVDPQTIITYSIAFGEEGVKAVRTRESSDITERDEVGLNPKVQRAADWLTFLRICQSNGTGNEWYSRVSVI